MNTSIRSLRLGLGSAALLISFGCTPTAAPSPELQETLTRLESKQDELLQSNKSLAEAQASAAAKLEALETKLGEVESNLGKKLNGRPGAAAKPGPRPGRPDPKATYKVAVFEGDAQKGPDNAKITIVEWSDFQ